MVTIGEKAMWGERPFVFSNLKTGDGLDRIIARIQEPSHARPLIPHISFL